MNFSTFTNTVVVLLTIFIIIHIKYVKPVLTRGLTAHECQFGGPRAGANFTLP